MALLRSKQIAKLRSQSVSNYSSAELEIGFETGLLVHSWVSKAVAYAAESELIEERAASETRDLSVRIEPLLSEFLHSVRTSGCAVFSVCGYISATVCRPLLGGSGHSESTVEPAFGASSP